MERLRPHRRIAKTKDLEVSPWNIILISNMEANYDQWGSRFYQ